MWRKNFFLLIQSIKKQYMNITIIDYKLIFFFESFSKFLRGRAENAQIN